MNISFVPKRKKSNRRETLGGGGPKSHARGVPQSHKFIRRRQQLPPLLNSDFLQENFKPAAEKFSYAESFWFHRFDSTVNPNTSRTSRLLEKAARSTHQALCNYYNTHTHTETHTNALSQQAAIWTGGAQTLCLLGLLPKPH